MHSADCFSNHMGLWLVEPRWFGGAVEAVKAGTWAARPRPAEVAEGPGYVLESSGVARILISGPMMKGRSKYGGASTIETKNAIRRAERDPEVEALVLYIDSPGGHVDGTQALADQVAATAETMPVYAHIEDLGASAAYWVAAQADRITANRSAQIGSIGVFAVVMDESEAMEEAGVKVHVVSTGAFKGAFAPGAPVEERHLDALQVEVDDVMAIFRDEVMAGRGMNSAAFAAVSDGRTWIAEKAYVLGLIDGIQSFEETMVQAGAEVAVRRRDAATRHTAAVERERAAQLHRQRFATRENSG